MKICILTERMKVGFGVDLVVDEQARRLTSLGFEVVVLVIHADFDQPPRDYELVVISRIMQVEDYGSVEWIRRILARARINDVDIWIIHTHPFYLWGQFLDGPVILVEHGMPPVHFFPFEHRASITQSVRRRFEGVYSTLQPFDAILSISHALHNWLPDVAQPSSRIIHHGVDHFPVADPAAVEDLRASLGIAPEECLVLWVGRMQLKNDEQPYKGFPTLLELVPELQQRVPLARFLLVGRISEPDRRRLAGQGFSVLANQTAEEMGRAFAAADILINLSEWEGFNLALLEAQVQGTPVVAYDHGPHPEIVRHGETGFLVKTREDLRDMVILMANDPPLRRRMGRQAAAFASSFTWEKNVDNLSALIKSCIARSPSRAEIVTLREAALAAAAVSASADVTFTTARELLMLDGRAFVAAAYRSAVGIEPAEEVQARFEEKLHSGISKRAVLCEIRDLPEANGLGRRIESLEDDTALTRTRQRFGSAVRRNAARFGWIDQLASSPWFTLPDEIFVRHAYRVLLGREAEQPAVHNWVAALRDGSTTRYLILTHIRHSDEGNKGRISDPDLAMILGEMPPVKPLLDLSPKRFRRVAARFGLGNALTSSVWFTLSDESFVRHAYRVLLGREAEAQAVDGWSLALREGTATRLAILQHIRSSAEGSGRPLREPELLEILEGTPREATLLDLMRRRLARAAALPRAHDTATDSLDRPTDQQVQSRSPVGIDQAIGGALEARLGELEELIRALQSQLSSQSDRPAGRSASSAAVTSWLGPDHAMLVAPGTVLEPDAASRLAAAVAATGSDIVFGDELEERHDRPALRLRRHGPFSHRAFLQDPDLGGVIAVRKALLERAGLPASAILTGQAVLRLVTFAHRFTYVRRILCRRVQTEIEANRPSADAFAAYLGLLDRPAVLAIGDGSPAVPPFDVRFPTGAAWKAAVVVVVREASEVDQMIYRVLDACPPHQAHVIVVGPTAALGDLSARTAVDGNLSMVDLPEGTSYGRMVNTAVHEAPIGCDLVVLMDGGVSPTTQDWLARLAETAVEPAVGIVAPITTYEDGQIRHAGLATGSGAPGSYVARFARPAPPHTSAVYLGPLLGPREASAVSRHCVMLRRAVFEDQGRMDETLGPDSADIDLCLRLRAAGLTAVVDGRVTMARPSSAPRWSRDLAPDEATTLTACYGDMLAQPDPYWHPDWDYTDPGPGSTHTTTIPPIEMR